MPKLTRYFLRAVLVNLVAALVLSLLLVLPATRDSFAGYGPVYIHLLVVGWATQMIFGVGIWMFPRRRPDLDHGGEWLGAVCFVFTNAGLVLRVVTEPSVASSPTALASAGLVVAAVLQLAAVLAFVVLAWPRVFVR